MTSKKSPSKSYLYFEGEFFLKYKKRKRLVNINGKCQYQIRQKISQ